MSIHLPFALSQSKGTTFHPWFDKLTTNGL